MIQRKSKKGAIIAFVCIFAFLFTLVLLENLGLFMDKVPKLLKHTSQLFAVLKKTAVYALAAVSMNLLTGFTGLFSLGQAGFMLLGAYTYAILTVPMANKDQVYYAFNGSAVKFSLPDLFGGSDTTYGLILGVLAAIVLAGIVAAAFSWLIGLPVLRLKSDYLAIATLGFAEIMRAIFQWQKLGPVTNGANMINKIPTFSSFNIDLPDGRVLRLSTFVPFLIAILCITLIVLLINSSYGRAFKAIREDEIAAEAMGINLAKHKQMSFCISSFFAGISGALFAMFVTNAQAKPFTTNLTYEILLIVVIGGIGSVSGSCIATFLYVACSEWWLRFLDDPTPFGAESEVPLLRPGFRMVVFSIVIMVVVLFFRKGIMGTKELPDLFKRKKNRVGQTIGTRNVALAIVFSVLTLGIYGVYWFMCLSDETSEYSGCPGMTGSKYFILNLLTGGVVGAIWGYKMGGKLGVIRRRDGKHEGSFRVVFLLLNLFGLQIVTMSLLQNSLNKSVKEAAK